MALYQNGILISGANTLPQMTLAEYQALPVSERPTYWERTDLNYNNIPASSVAYGNGTVKDALDDLTTFDAITPTINTTYFSSIRTSARKVGSIVQLDSFFQCTTKPTTAADVITNIPIVTLTDIPFYKIDGYGVPQKALMASGSSNGIIVNLGMAAQLETNAYYMLSVVYFTNA